MPGPPSVARSSHATTVILRITGLNPVVMGPHVSDWGVGYTLSNRPMAFAILPTNPLPRFVLDQCIQLCDCVCSGESLSATPAGRNGPGRNCHPSGCAARKPPFADNRSRPSPVVPLTRTRTFCYVGADIREANGWRPVLEIASPLADEARRSESGAATSRASPLDLVTPSRSPRAPQSAQIRRWGARRRDRPPARASAH